MFLLHLLKPGGYMHGLGLKLKKNSTSCPQSANTALYFVRRAQPTNTNLQNKQDGSLLRITNTFTGRNPPPPLFEDAVVTPLRSGLLLA